MPKFKRLFQKYVGAQKFTKWVVRGMTMATQGIGNVTIR